MFKQTYQKHGKSRQRTPFNANHFVHCRHHHHDVKERAEPRNPTLTHACERCISQNEIFYFLIEIRTYNSIICIEKEEKRSNEMIASFVHSRFMFVNLLFLGFIKAIKCSEKWKVIDERANGKCI